MTKLAWTLILVCLLGVPARSQTAQIGPGLPPSIRTSGEATVTAKPDRAIIDIGVVTQAATAQAAAGQNATRLDAVVRALKAAVGSAAEIKTISYSLEPNYRYPKPGGQAEVAGYTARNTVQVTTPDLSSAGNIIDAATKAGANNVDRLQFTLKDDRAARAEALREAAAKAKAGAAVKTVVLIPPEDMDKAGKKTVDYRPPGR
jgi:uncharacterized protein YggE